jgi:hypothetical protein
LLLVLWLSSKLLIDIVTSTLGETTETLNSKMPQLNIGIFHFALKVENWKNLLIITTT